jgi:ribose/xylose/arabinose/galactoside ABC-type transport system permease subunit
VVTDTTTPVRVEPARRQQVRLGRMRDLALVPAMLVLMVIGFIVSPIFLSVENLTNVLQQQTELSLVVLAEAVILISGKLDLSLESTVGLAPALAVALIVPEASNGLGTELSAALAIPLCLAIGVLIGAFNGLLILKLQLSSFIVTLGMLIELRGLQIAITGGQNLFNIPRSFTYLGSAKWLGVPASIWVSALAWALGLVLLGYFRLGRALYAIGGNIDAARAAGIRTDRVVWAVLVIGSTLAAVAGMLMTGRLGSVASAQGQGMIFIVFAAAVVGGISLNGGKGTLFGALCGVLVLGLIQNILTLGGVPGEWFQAIYGAIILGILVLARLTTGKAQD